MKKLLDKVITEEIRDQEGNLVNQAVRVRDLLVLVLLLAAVSTIMYLAYLRFV